MKPVTAQILFFIIIMLCGYLVAASQGPIKIASFGIGVMAAALSIYVHWKNKNSN